MKTIKFLLGILLISFIMISCDERDFDAPPITAPEYTGDPANMTIRELKDKFPGSTPVVITDSVIFTGRVTSSDEDGNFYKQLVIQDEEGTAIQLSIDQTGISGLFKVGQKVFVNAKGLHIGFSGGETILGGSVYNGYVGQMTRVAFETHVSRDGFPERDRVPATLVTIPQISINSSDYVFKLVRLENVKFQLGGSDVFAPEGSPNNNGERIIEDLEGNTLMVRTSVYASYARDTLPTGYGTLVGILGRYNGTWQFTFRNSADIFDFAEVKGTINNPYTVTEAIEKQTDENRVWVQGYVVGSVKAGVTSITSNDDIEFTGPFMNNTLVMAPSADVRDYSRCIVVNLPEGSDIRTNINLADNATNLGRQLMVRGSLQKTANTFNIVGLYLAAGEGTASDYRIVINELFSETFGTGTYPSGNRPKIADFTDFDMGPPIQYSDRSGRADIRTASGLTAFVWLPANNDSYLTIEGIDLSGYRNITLSYDLMGNIYDAGETTNMNAVEVYCNGVAIPVPDIQVTEAIYTNISLSIPENTTTLEFKAVGTKNNLGLRLDNIKMVGDR